MAREIGPVLHPRPTPIRAGWVGRRPGAAKAGGRRARVGEMHRHGESAAHVVAAPDASLERQAARVGPAERGVVALADERLERPQLAGVHLAFDPERLRGPRRRPAPAMDRPDAIPELLPEGGRPAVPAPAAAVARGGAPLVVEAADVVGVLLALVVDGFPVVQSSVGHDVIPPEPILPARPTNCYIEKLIFFTI
jgi:hypothetical protein